MALCWLMMLPGYFYIVVLDNGLSDFITISLLPIVR
jgi:hypothetical protein